MATRAERFKAEQERSKPKRPKSKVKPGQRRAPTSDEAVREMGSTDPAPHNFQAGERSSKTKTYAYEFTDKKKRPSRKSTRISEDHVKTGVELQHRQLLRTTSPSARTRKR